MSRHRAKRKEGVIGKNIRKAGDKLKAGAKSAAQGLNELDQRYADSLYKDGMSDFGQVTRTIPLSSVPGHTVTPDSSPINKRIGAATDVAIGAANVASRYALPAGGVTLAGKGLLDLTAQFGGKADQQEDNQLPLA